MFFIICYKKWHLELFDVFYNYMHLLFGMDIDMDLSSLQIHMLKPWLIWDLFGNRTFKVETKIEGCHKSGDLNPIRLISLKEYKELPGMHKHRVKAIWGHSEKVTVLKSRRGASGKTNPASTFSWTFIC